ncbi:hypothetical protein [Polyangium sp. y55x31]|uniref:bestrophin-like domain n=1 Tax=Polyangium sp. y55x31 TaxID=3042688 RepID=UPI00248238A2|nr:hypothetical protein [Polyangium sp. y55x31]MDI1478886.1 hypothetical protein [Polyangium sp. y55x31]
MQIDVEHRLSWEAVLALTSAILLLSNEFGYRFGLRHSTESIESKKAQAGVIQGALLALLGLLLAFSFHIAESRFSTRKLLLREEANAIRTAYMRAEMLPEPDRDRVEPLLREYVTLRIAPSTPEAISQAIERSEVLQGALWDEAVRVGRDRPESMVMQLFVESLDEILDLHESRVTVGLYQRLPRPILTMLYTLSILTISLIGWSSGLTRRRVLTPTVAVILAISAVIMLIIELDRPTGTLFHVSTRAMEDVQRTLMQHQAPAAKD